MSKRSNRATETSLTIAASLLLIIALSACAASRQPRGVPDESGFLGNYSELRPGKGDEAALVFVRPVSIGRATTR